MNNVLLRRLEIAGVTPNVQGRKGTVNYTATFEIEQDANSYTLNFSVSTPEGFTQAAILACDKLAAHANWLQCEAEQAKFGPHILSL